MKPTLESAASMRAMRFTLQRSQVQRVLLFGDLLLVNLAALVALWLGIQRSTWWLTAFSWETFLLWFLFLSVLWFLLAQVMDLYNLRVAAAPGRAVRATLGGVLGVVAVYLVLYFIAAPQSLPRHLIIFFAVIAAVLLGLWRGSFAMALGSGPLARRVLVIGSGPSASKLLEALRQHAGRYYQVAAVIDPDVPTPAEAARRILAAPVPDEVILSQSGELSDPVLSALVVQREQGVQIVNMATVFEELTGRVPVEHVGNTWSMVLPLEQDATRGLNGFLKRALDVVLGAAGLVLALPLWPLIALAIWLDSPGEILVRQARVGQGGRVFTLYKFRTMIADAEGDGVPLWAQENDPRVTRVGRLLRRFKLDEVPQFLNVLRGEMSLVGPRPERPELVEHLAREIPFYRLRHVVRPGLTGWAAICFRYGRSVEDALVKLQYDLYYIKHQSLFLDALILAKTIGAILVPPREARDAPPTGDR